MKTYLTVAVLAFGLQMGAVSASLAQEPPAAVEQHADIRALLTVPAKNGATLAVSSPAFKMGGDIPFENTQYRGNVFPGLTWTKGPRGTKSYAVIMQDTDGNNKGMPILHWTMYDIPATVMALDAGMSAPPEGAAYGPNIRGPAHAYMGPRTPAGPKHRYHLQVFALDTVIPMDPMMTYDALTGAMKDHVLASGETIGLGQVDPTAPPPPPRPAAN